VSQALNPNTVRRLAFIRFLYGQGLEQVTRPQPLAATSLLCFHDAVEMFLLLAAEHLNVNLDRNTSFDSYWTQIGARPGMQLPSRNAMRRMNNSRVNFKHHGSIPSATDLEQFRADVTTFLTDATRLVFDTDFHGLDMIDIVTQQGALTRLRNAEDRAAEGDYIEALALLSETFYYLINDYDNRKRTSAASTAYSFGPQLGPGFSSAKSIPGINSQLGAQLDTIMRAVPPMRQAIRVLALGLDYRRYARFEMLAPFSFNFIDGRRHRDVLPKPGLQVGDEEYRFCKQFVIEVALRLAEMDFDLDLYSLQLAHENTRMKEAPPDSEGS
jgi:hypothetical protein